MKKKLLRREFITQMVFGVPLLALNGTDLLARRNHRIAFDEEEPLHDWSAWKRYRSDVHHPSLTIKSEDLERAKANIQKYEWAQNYAQNIVRQAEFFIELINEHTLENFIQITTPGDPLWTPCPSCREKGLPFHPHGQWKWTILNPDVLVCEICQETFPHSDYPEDMVLQTTWGIPQSISFYGGAPFTLFGFDTARPSFTANIRSRKVKWCAGACRTIAEAYSLTDNPKYASLCKAILNRFATCYPNWLVHVGYGEYADMDPRVAAVYIKNLPKDELTPPPNVPDRQLWTGYWSAGRAGGVGMESEFVRKVVESYDLTCEAMSKDNSSIYSREERMRIEKNLLLETTILLVCDKSINNKSVGNRTAAGLVGICVGHPELMRFGLEGFNKTVNEWFLEDGGTKESPAYGFMTMAGIWDFAQSVKSYSDPNNYKDVSGNRMDNLNLYKDPAFEKVWSAFYNGLQGDLMYPPYADSFKNVPLDPSFIEIMVANYENNPEYLALLREWCGENLEEPSGPVPKRYYEKEMDHLDQISSGSGGPRISYSIPLYYRDWDLNRRRSTPVKLPDWNPKNLRLGHLRTGPYGRESLLLLNASHWRGHNHWDSLNLYYWKNGFEILSDFGYLWDHPDKKMTSRTLAHNTVLIDENDQISHGRGGEMEHFRTSGHVKMMEAQSSAYKEASKYRRTTAIIDHGEGRNYVVDIFRVQGGQKQDYVFHLDTLDYQISEPNSWQDFNGVVYDLEEVNRSISSSWNIKWPVSDKMQAQAWILSQDDEESYIGEGWGQIDWKNSDVGAKATYIVRRCKGDGLKTFVSVYEGSDDKEFCVRGVSYDPNINLLVIDTSEGKDYVMSALDNREIRISTDAGDFDIEGHFVAVSIQNEMKKWEFFVE